MPSGLIALLDDVAGIAKLAAASLDDVGAAAGKASTKAAELEKARSDAANRINELSAELAKLRDGSEFRAAASRAKDAEARAQFFLHTLTDQQAATMQEFNKAAKEVDIATADGMVTAQAAVDRAKEKMDAVDARAEKNEIGRAHV